MEENELQEIEEEAMIVVTPFRENINNALDKIKEFFNFFKDKEEKKKLGDAKYYDIILKRADDTFIGIKKKGKIKVEETVINKLYICESNKNTIDKQEFKNYIEVYTNLDFKKLKKNKAYRYVATNELLDTERLNTKVKDEYYYYLGEIIYDLETKVYSKYVDKNIIKLLKAENLEELKTENMELKDM